MEPNKDATTIEQEKLWAENAQIFLDLCKSHHLILEKHDSEFSTKAIGIATFAVVLFGTGASWVNTDTCGIFEWGILVINALIVLSIIFIAMATVARPKLWHQPGELSEFDKHVYDVSKATLLANVASGYMNAVSKNIPTAESRGKRLQAITILIVIEVALLVAFRVCLLFPG